MGISQGGYLGKKLVTFGTTTLYTPDPARAAPGAAVTLPGANLGTAGQLLMNGTPIATTSWSATSIGFSVQAVNPAGDAAWTAPEPVVQLVRRSWASQATRSTSASRRDPQPGHSWSDNTTNGVIETRP